MKLAVSVSFGLIFATSCAAKTPDSVGSLQEKVVYGLDDRQDVYQVASSDLRSLTENAIVALMPRGMVDTSDPDQIRLRAYELGEWMNLCDGERFVDDPVAADCSGTLIDDDLVLTAGHCVEDQDDCESQRYVFNYYKVSKGTLATITSDDVFECQRLVVQSRTDDLRDDYAIIQLDRPATSEGRRPAGVKLENTAMVADDPVTVIGFGSGIPAKVDSGGSVKNPRSNALDYFTASTDTFGGNSGSGVFDANLDLVGALVRGESDYTDGEDGSCRVVNVVSETEGGSYGFEHIAYVHHAIEALCESGWQSARLCGTEGSICGDDACTDDETKSVCPIDCGGDDLVDSVVDNGNDDDIVTPSELEIPDAWTCSPDYFAASDGCDCGCGTLDPDCEDTTQEVFNCYYGQMCGSDAQCMQRPDTEEPGATSSDASPLLSCATTTPGHGASNAAWPLIATVVGLVVRRRRSK